MLLHTDPADKDRLLEQAQYCEAQGMTNAAFMEYKFVCFQSLRPIEGAPLRCVLCSALFDGRAAKSGESCPICNLGKLK